MSRPLVALDAATGEVLYDVFNEQGFALLLGVSVADAGRIADERQAAADREWAGDIRIVRARRGPDVLKVRTSIEHVAGRLEVWCEVDRLVPSGLSVDELFAMLRPQLVAAVEEAAARAPDQLPASKPVTVRIDVDAADPGVWLLVSDPAACLADVDGHLDKLKRIVQGIIDGHAQGGKP